VLDRTRFGRRIEALAARRAVLVERDREALEAIRTNVAALRSTTGPAPTT
jgi:16S rRNA G966 N2-methylase RsmD